LHDIILPHVIIISVGGVSLKSIKEYLDDSFVFESLEYEFKFKLNRSNPESWVKTIVAFANDVHGKMFIGVNDQGIAVGINPNVVDDEQKYFVDYIRNKVYPSIAFNVSYIETDENNIVICIEVPVHKGEVVVYKDNSSGQIRDRIYRRYPGSTYELTSVREMINFGITKNQIPYDLTPTHYDAANYTFHSLNQKYKERTNSENDLTNKQLQSIGLITEDNKLTIAGMYFVDNCPESFPSIHLRKWPGLNKGSDDVIDAKEYKLNLIEQLNEAEKFIRNNSKTGLHKNAGGASDKWSYPAIAITEAICNAIGHRDYNIKGTQIDIDIYQDRIEIVSPGSFLPEGRAQDYVDISKIPSKRRNEAITNTLTICRLMQRYGSGFEKILEEYKYYDKKFQPKITSEQSWFTITLMDVAYTSNEKAVNITPQLPKMQKLVYNIILNNPGIKRPSICKIAEITDGSAKSIIRELSKKQLIHFIGSPKNGGYHIISEE